MTNNKWKESTIKLYLISSFFFILLSLGSNLAYIEHINFGERILKKENINNMRGLLPFVILSVNIFIIFKKKIVIKTHEYLLIGLILSYFLGTVTGKIEHIDLFKIHFIVAPIALVTTLAISRELKEFTKKIIFYYFLIFFLIVITILFYSQNTIGYGGGWISFFGEEIIFINSNGISRISCVINFVLLSSLVNNNNYINLRTILIVTSCIFLSSMIILSEGRVNISIMLLTTLLIFLNYKIIFLKKLILFFLIILSSIIFSIIISNQVIKISDQVIKKETRFKKVDLISESFDKNVNIFFQNDITAENFGRFQKWKDLFQHSFNLNTKKILLGEGPEIDREILTNLGYRWNADSANSFLYSFLCGGLIGFILYLSIILLLVNNLKIFFKYKKYLLLKSTQNIFFSLVPIMLLLRSFFENSIASWSLDFIILATCLNYFYLQKTD
jgi:hypothetical protein